MPVAPHRDAPAEPTRLAAPCYQQDGADDTATLLRDYLQGFRRSRKGNL
jgi:hypothetical protein